MKISNMGQWLGKQARFLVAVALAAVIGGITTAGVMAAIPDSNGTIHACYTTGLLARVKIIDSATQTCGGSETAINWSQQGSPANVLKDLPGNDFSEANWVGWDLRNMNFTGTIVGGANLRNADLSGSTVTNSNFGGSLLEGANLAGLIFTGASLGGAQLKDADLSGVNFDNATLTSTNFQGQNLSGYDFSNTPSFEGIGLTSVNFSNVSLPSSPNFAFSIMSNANLSNNDFTGANFTYAFLLDADFTGSNLTGAIWVTGEQSATCPNGTLASDHGDTCIGHL